MSERLRDKVVVVTGGARGIGAGIAEVCRRHGARVAVLDLDQPEAERTAQRLAGGTLALGADAADESSMKEALRQVAGACGGIDVVVNNAGASRDANPPMGESPVPPITNLEVQAWDDQLANNLRTTFVGAKCAVPYLQARGGGSMVNIASIAGLSATPSLPAYGAAKAGVIHLSRSLALELGPQNIRVNAICPGLLWTRAWETLAEYLRESQEEFAELEPRQIFLAMVARMTPLGREQTPEDIGELVAFLASDAARNITGQEIKVDGGITLGAGSI